MMPGKKFRPVPDSVYQKRPIGKSHNGKVRKCAISAAVFPSYDSPDCKMRTVHNMTIFRTP